MQASCGRPAITWTINRHNRLIVGVILSEPTLFDFSPDVLAWLAQNGWHTDRAVDVPSWIPSQHCAHSILQSFGGLSFLSYDDEFPDEPTAELEFRPLTLKDKTATIWSRLLRSKVVGIGYGHNQHENVYADADGRIYGGSLMHDAFYLRGLTLPDCFHNLLTNTRARSMLRPDQRSVMLYGVTFTSASEEVYRYKQTK